MSEPLPDHILQMGLGFWASKVLLSAVEMELFTELSKHPEDLETLQERLGIHPRSARDFFDALVALSTKASGTPHPAVLSIWNSAGDKFPNFSLQGEHDWVLDTKLGELPLSILLIGKVEG